MRAQIQIVVVAVYQCKRHHNIASLARLRGIRNPIHLNPAYSTLRLCGSIASLELYSCFSVDAIHRRVEHQQRIIAEAHYVKVFQRVQSGLLIVALLAVPFALVVRGYCCTQKQCTMLCCLHNGHAMGSMCNRPSSSTSNCGAHCNSQNGPDYGLAVPIAPFQLSAGVKLPGLKAARAISPVAAVSDFAGFSVPPFQPPRS